MTDWHPSASIENLKQRAQILAQIRQFFVERDVLEVETPILSQASVTDPALHSFKTELMSSGGHDKKTLYLQTSPEYAMKRLLAANSGPIFQITKSFRNEECGRYHNPEFTMLEWYQPGFDHMQLMDDMDALLQLILNGKKALRCTYQALFEQYLDICPHSASASALENLAKSQHIPFNFDASQDEEKDFWLFLLMTHCIEPKLGFEAPVFVYDYPASQAALAKVRQGKPPVAERFEVYIQGIELANGFHELTNAQEQEQRFKQELQMRQSKGLAPLPIDHHLLDALNSGLPNCAGVALGIDRLVMLALGQKHIADVVSFTVLNA